MHTLSMPGTAEALARSASFFWFASASLSSKNNSAVSSENSRSDTKKSRRLSLKRTAS